MNLVHFEPTWQPAGSYASVPTAVGTELIETNIPVLIAEDGPVSRKVLRRRIEKGGFATLVTGDGNEAMMVLRT